MERIDKFAWIREGKTITFWIDLTIWALPFSFMKTNGGFSIGILCFYWGK